MPNVVSDASLDAIRNIKHSDRKIEVHNGQRPPQEVAVACETLYRAGANSHSRWTRRTGRHCLLHPLMASLDRKYRMRKHMYATRL